MTAETKIFIFLAMVFCHIIDDYCLQGILASMKQKSWWRQNAPDPLYADDYMMALAMHAFSWSFMIMIPIVVAMQFAITKQFLVVFVCNWVVHGLTDDLKANRHQINLCTDQTIHIWQILTTWVVMLT